MRILHTSDWHLGRTLHGVNLHAYHRDFHDFLVRTVREQRIDVVVIAGDVYDRSVPPTESVELLSDTLTLLADIATVILTPGNHDSATRLGFGSALMRPGIHFMTHVHAIEHPVSVHDEHGEVLFFGLPFLDPDVARHTMVGPEAPPLSRSHEAVTRAAMDRVRAKIAHASASRSVVLAHTFVSGGKGSDSERDLSVGGVDSVPGSVFEGVDYVALGHLHGCQNVSALVPGHTQAWYSGSPLAFSFSEAHHTKAVLVVEMDANGECEVRSIPTPVPRPLVHVRGPFSDILALADEHADDWVRVTVVQDARPERMFERLHSAFHHVLLVEFESTSTLSTRQAPLISEAQPPQEVVGDFLEFLTGAQPTSEQSDIIEQIVTAARMRHADPTGVHAAGVS